MFVMLLLAFGVMSYVALPQMREGKTVFTQGGLDTVDDARRRAIAMARARSAGGAPNPADDATDDVQASRLSRLRAPIGWTEPQAGPRHAR
jgi:hypothetical protein